MVEQLDLFDYESNLFAMIISISNVLIAQFVIYIMLVYTVRIRLWICSTKPAEVFNLFFAKKFYLFNIYLEFIYLEKWNYCSIQPPCIKLGNYNV